MKYYFDIQIEACTYLDPRD